MYDFTEIAMLLISLVFALLAYWKILKRDIAMAV